MANIKFSQFTVGNTESDIDFVVGYKGGDNIQISPANLLSATLTGYLPLTGGTMSGNVKFNDNIELRLGSGADLKAYHSGAHTYFDNNVGDLVFRNLANDKDIIFQSDDGSGGITEYFRVDGGTSDTRFVKNTRHLDNVRAEFGSSGNFIIRHDGADTILQNGSGGGDLTLQVAEDDHDMIFQCDNGTGGVTDYFRLDGSDVRININATNGMQFMDNVKGKFGTSGDLEIYHDSSNSTIDNSSGHLFIRNSKVDRDILFQGDDGTGSATTTYFAVDGGVEMTTFSKDTRHNDNVKGRFGSGGDLYIEHDGTDSKIINTNGDLSIQNQADNKRIRFQSDDGSGGVATYFQLDGNQSTSSYLYTNFPDNSVLSIGNGFDTQIYHTGTNTIFYNQGGNLEFQQATDDGDMIFKCDDGSGSLTEYFKLQGSNERLVVAAPNGMKFNDNIPAKFGNGSDFQMYHNGSHTYLINGTGDIEIINNTNDGDIQFFSDDGSGSTTEYFRVDGGATNIIFSKDLFLNDNVNIGMGNSGDYAQFHDGTNTYLSNGTGDFYIRNQADDKDILFQADDGSGGNTTYFQLDGSNAKTSFSKNYQALDNVKAQFGDSNDLEIYHDGSDSYIKDSGTGSLSVLSSLVQLKSSGGTNNLAKFFSGGNSYIYANNVLRIEATSSGAKVHGNLNITSVSEYADNTAAIAAGLTTGDVYRTGDLLKIVH